MAKRPVLVAVIAMASACGGSTQGPTPSEESPPASPKPSKSGFAFEPTIRQHAPEGLQLEILLEVGNASEASLDTVIATAKPERTPPLRIELWTFDQRDKTKLEPKGDPVWLLPLTTEEAAPGRDQLDRLRRALSLPNSVKTRPAGLEAETPDAALAQIGEAARVVRGEASAKEQLAAAQTLFRGLDDDVVLDAEGLPGLLDAAVSDGWRSVEIEGASGRRATATVGGMKLEILRKAEGWQVTRVTR